MIIWILIALTVFIVSLIVALRSMRSIANEEAQLFNEQLPPQPGGKHSKPTSVAQHNSSQAVQRVRDKTSVEEVVPTPVSQMVSASTPHQLQAEKIAKASSHDAAHDSIKGEPPTQEVPQQQVATVHQVAPRTIEEARQRLQEAFKITKQLPKNEKKYLGEFKGTITIQK